MIAHTRRVVARSASPQKRRNAACNQSTGGQVVVDSGHAADGNFECVEELLAASNRGPRGTLNVVAKLRPPVVERSEEHTSELQSLTNLVCRLLLEKKK